jgi:hypothetical protein
MFLNYSNCGNISQRNSILFAFLFTFIEEFDSLLSINEFDSKYVSFNDDDVESVDDGESIINSGRSRVTVPVCLCQ